MIICYSQQSCLCTGALSRLKSSAQFYLVLCAVIYTLGNQEEYPPTSKSECSYAYVCVSFGGRIGQGGVVHL